MCILCEKKVPYEGLGPHTPRIIAALIANQHLEPKTRTLYKIMWNILDLLYECNIGDPPSNSDVLPITSHILQIEHQLLAWQSSLAPPSGLITPQELAREGEGHGDGNGNFSLTRRFRVILTLRYHNVRILAHRRMLDLYLGSLERGQGGSRTSSKPYYHDNNHNSSSSAGSQQHDSMLKQVGHRSKGICMQSASDVISIVHMLVRAPEPGRRGLLGAWWFTLYYSKGFFFLSFFPPYFIVVLFLFSLPPPPSFSFPLPCSGCKSPPGGRGLP